MKPKFKMEFEAIGTHWYIESSDGLVVQREIHDKIDVLDKTWSRFRDDSLVAKMSKKAGKYDIEPSDMQMMRLYEKLYSLTDGLVTPLIGQTLVDAGYDKDYSLQQKRIVSKPLSWDKVIELSDNHITIKQPGLLDVGAVGKGYVIDQVASIIQSDDYIVDAGGDIRVGAQMKRIGLENPSDSNQLIGYADIQNKSICGSSQMRRKWSNWSHIVNPASLKPVDEIIAVWAIADSAMVADGLSTALFFVAPYKLRSLTEFEYCIIYKDGRLESYGDSFTIFKEGGA